MADGDRHPEPPAADGGAATLPGVAATAGVAATLPGVAAPPPGVAGDDKAAKADVGTDTTLAGAAPPPSALGVTAAGTAAPAPRAKRRTADAAHSETLPAADAPHAATLPGPHVVADLPSLPRIDDSLYAIGEEIARGGMGKILSARDRR
ncbi:MAG TPA: hypothetical protein VLB44_21030, partial [Kofleriaceae bacterium]|nr:hypothetical protein [Kofleriaceae bacterium]